jgi:hypothetical protein
VATAAATVEAAPASFRAALYELVPRASFELNRLDVKGADGLGLVTLPGADDPSAARRSTNSSSGSLRELLTTATTSIRGRLLRPAGLASVSHRLVRCSDTRQCSRNAHERFRTGRNRPSQRGRESGEKPCKATTTAHAPLRTVMAARELLVLACEALLGLRAGQVPRLRKK